MVSDDGTKIFIGTDGKLFVKNEKGEYVPALDKNNRKIRIGVYKTTTDQEGNETKSLDN